MGRPHHLLFICTGNICRSPMAEYIARDYAERCGVELEARSASTLGLEGRPAEPKMVTVGREIGLDLTPHVCQPITDELVDWADAIYVMELKHHAHLTDFHPGSNGKVHLLGRLDGVDEIADPIGAWFTWRFRRCRDQIERCVKKVIDPLPSERP
jgi:protein-tyrosine phosphatase